MQITEVLALAIERYPSIRWSADNRVPNYDDEDAEVIESDDQINIRGFAQAGDKPPAIGESA